MPVERDRAGVEDELLGLIRSYRQTLETDRRQLHEDFHYVHAPAKWSASALGTRAWILLMLGRDGQDPLFLQAKEAPESVLELFVGKIQYPNHGQRVVVGQRLMQAADDIFLVWERPTGIDGQPARLLIRQLRDWRGAAGVDTVVPSVMLFYARMVGATLARAHARSGDRIDFSASDADQNERDYQALVDAVKAGRLQAETGL